MYDMACFLNDVWNITFLDGKKLSINPPKIKDRYKLAEFANNENIFKGLIAAATMIINNNKENITYTSEELENLFTEKSLNDFMDKYNKWIDGELKN